MGEVDLTRGAVLSSLGAGPRSRLDCSRDGSPGPLQRGGHDRGDKMNGFGNGAAERPGLRRPRGSRLMGSSKFLQCDLHLTGHDRARLTIVGQDYSGRPRLDSPRLPAADLHPAEYGKALFDAVFRGDLLTGYRVALDKAHSGGARLRFRLHIEENAPREIHDFHWELLYDAERDEALACSSDTVFSRHFHLPVEHGRPVTGKPRLLVVLSTPEGLDRYRLPEVDRDQLRDSVKTALELLGGRVSYEFLEGAATLDAIRNRLKSGEFHALHFVGHGLLRSDGAAVGLMLENEDGGSHLVDEKSFKKLFSGFRNLRLITLIACHSGAQPGADPSSGVGPALVKLGTPAVVAMGQAISVGAAARFTEHFYRELARSGRVDEATNEARLRLQLANPGGIDWGIPILFMRLKGGRLWAKHLPPPQPPAPGRSRGGRQIPDLLPYMPDRADQKDELYEVLRRMRENPTRPVVCLLPGDELQAQEMFLRRLKEVELPKLLELSPERGVSAYALGYPRRFRGRGKLRKRVRRNLAEVVRGSPSASLEDINQSLAAIPGPVLIHAHLWLTDCGRQAPDLVMGFLDFWRDWPELSAGQVVLVLLFVKYRSKPTGFFEKRRLKRIYQHFESYESANLGRPTCTLLSTLEGVGRTEVEDWARGDEVTSLCRVEHLVSKIRSLFRQESTTIPMEHLATALTEILKN